MSNVITEQEFAKNEIPDNRYVLRAKYADNGGGDGGTTNQIVLDLMRPNPNWTYWKHNSDGSFEQIDPENLYKFQQFANDFSSGFEKCEIRMSDEELAKFLDADEIFVKTELADVIQENWYKGVSRMFSPESEIGELNMKVFTNSIVNIDEGKRTPLITLICALKLNQVSMDIVSSGVSNYMFVELFEI